MSLNAPARSALGVYVRSALGMRLKEQAPTPPPAVPNTYPWSGIMDEFGVYSDDPINYCPTAASPLNPPVNARSGEFCRLRGKLHARNLPITLIACDGSEYTTLPVLDCITLTPPQWGRLHRVGDVVWNMADGDYLATQQCSLSDGQMWRFEGHTKTAIPALPPTGEVTGYRITLLNQAVQEYDASAQRVRLPTNHEWTADMLLAITGGSVNDGRYLVTSVTGDWLTVAGSIQSESPAQGVANNIVGQWHHCGPYTAISNPPTGVYPARIEASPFVRSGVIKINGTTNYDGLHAAEFVDSTWSRLPALTWLGDELNTGSYVNNVGVFTSTHGWPTPRTTRMKVVSTHYSGTYDSGATVDANTIEITDVWADQPDTGTIERPSVTFNITGATNFRIRDVIISGTGLYDGTYRALIDPSAQQLYAEDLADIFFAGTATGTWQEVGGAQGGTITSVTRDYPIANFTAVAPDRGGPISRIVSSVIAVAAPNHGRPGTGKAWLHVGQAINWTRYPLIGAPDGNTLILETDFRGTAAGNWTARDYD